MEVLSIFLRSLTPEEVEFTNQLGEFCHRFKVIVKDTVIKSFDWVVNQPIYDLAYYAIILMLMSPIFVALVKKSKLCRFTYTIILMTVKFIISLLKWIFKLVIVFRAVSLLKRK